MAAINLHYHPDVTKEEAFDPDFALRFAAKAIKEGKEDAWTVCNCFQFVKAIVGPLDRPVTPNSTPRSGSVAIFDYKGTPHYGVVTELKVDGFMIRESNYVHCKTTVRLVKWNDPALKGFFMPTTSP